MFDSTKTALKSILEDIESGKMQLPDFQRGWIWNDDRVQSLLASVAVSFPIGAIMTLETGGQHIKLKPRPIEGTPDQITDENLETLILDGQQRMTSLYQSLMCKRPVLTKDTRNKKVSRFYYISMEEALSKETDLEEAIIAVPEDRIQKELGGIVWDLSTRNNEYEQSLFPVTELLDSAEWRRGYNKFWDHDEDKIKFYDNFDAKVISCFEKYQVPIIKLGKDTPKEAVCLVFEKVNTGGVSLTVFELLTATFAADDFNLRDDWKKRKENMENNGGRILDNPDNDHFLQAVALLTSYKKRENHFSNGGTVDKAPGISCKRRDILNLTLTEYNEWADEAEKGFIKASRFINKEKIFWAQDIPYKTQLVPLACILSILGKYGDAGECRQKIARWYWCGILGELYGGAIETRFSLDLPQMLEYVRSDESIPKTISDAYFAPERLLTLRTRNSAAYKGIYALLMRDGCGDFRTGERIETSTFFNDDIDIHHIFPKSWCEDNENNIPKESYNSIINKTAISARTNRIIGGKAPSIYLNRLQDEFSISPDTMDVYLKSHGINSVWMREDKYWNFFEDRAEHLLKIIEGATGMTINRDKNLFSSNTKTDADEDEDEGEDE